MEQIISFYQRCYMPGERKVLKLADTFRIIKSNRFQRETEYLRKERDKDRRSRYKVQYLPAVTYAGTFSYRSNSHLVEASGIAAMDFDEYSNSESIKSQIIQDQHVLAAFKSPSGGLKVLIKIPKIKNDAEYKVVYDQLLHYYGNYSPKNDPATKDVSRLCFLSYDPKLYLNPNAVEFQVNWNIQPQTDIPSPIRDNSRSGVEWRKLISLCRTKIREGKDSQTIKQESYSEMMVYDKWKNPHHPNYREHQFAGAFNYALEQESKPTQTHLHQELMLRSYQDFENIKPEKDYIVEKFIPPKSLIMVYSPPKNYKSIIIQYMCLCIVSGRPFLNFKTKKQGVVISDKENHDQIIRDRWIKLRKGMKLRKKDYPLYYLNRQTGDFLNEDFMQQLKEVIQENNIKLVVFDTMHRHGDYDENSANDINKIYTKTFSPLIDEMGVSIIVLHHTNKDGKYRGSIDLIGMCDNVLRIIKQGKSNGFTIINTDNRRGELDDQHGIIDFDEDSIIVYKTEKGERARTDREKFIEIVNRIESYFKKPEDCFRRQDIKVKLELDEVDCTISTLKRVLDWMVDKEKLIRDGKKGYSYPFENTDVKEETVE